MGFFVLLIIILISGRLILRYIMPFVLRRYLKKIKENYDKSKQNTNSNNNNINIKHPLKKDKINLRDIDYTEFEEVK